MISIRLLQVSLITLLLGGCTFFFDVQDSAQPDPMPDSRQQRVLFEQIQRTMQSMKQADKAEVSEVGPNEAQSGPEKWTVCSRASFGSELRYFTFFLRGEAVSNWRPAVINDKCEVRSFASFEHAR